MDYFPVFLDLRDKAVLVIGQYRVLQFKITKMIDAGAKIIYLSDTLPEKLKKYVQSGIVQYYNEPFNETHLNDIWLVVCGSYDETLKNRIKNAAAQHHIFCNFVDEAPISSFISPSVIAKGDLTIAISTKGKSPALNKFLKNQILSQIGDEYMQFAEILGKMRSRVIEKIPGQKRRSDLFDAIVQNDEVLALIKSNQMAAAETMVSKLIDEEIKRLSN